MAVEPVVALISIHPRFSQAILEGTKLVELRRVPFRRSITHVLMYETGCTGAIVGYFEVRKVVEDHPRAVWKKYNGTSGLTKQEFDGYYRGKKRAVAIEVGKTKRLVDPVKLSELKIGRPPQSFMYVASSALEGFVSNATAFKKSGANPPEP